MVENPEQKCVLSMENDSFGFEGYLMCHPCWEKAKSETAAELRGCRDCNQQVPRDEGIEWRWYDFYAPQGDEAIFVCNNCENLEPHKERVARDNHSRNIELGLASYFEDDEDEYDLEPNIDDVVEVNPYPCPEGCKRFCCDTDDD